jgi:hypothetical protein
MGASREDHLEPLGVFIERDPSFDAGLAGVIDGGLAVGVVATEVVADWGGNRRDVACRTAAAHAGEPPTSRMPSTALVSVTADAEASRRVEYQSPNRKLNGLSTPDKTEKTMPIHPGPTADAAAATAKNTVQPIVMIRFVPTNSGSVRNSGGYRRLANTDVHGRPARTVPADSSANVVQRITKIIGLPPAHHRTTGPRDRLQ